METIHPFVPTSLVQNPSLHCFSSTLCQYFCTPRPFGDSYLLSRCKPTSIGSIISPMFQSNRLAWNLMPAIDQLHQWVGKTRNLEISCISTGCCIGLRGEQGTSSSSAKWCIHGLQHFVCHILYNVVQHDSINFYFCVF
jgi:hypothetical protein